MKHLEFFLKYFFILSVSLLLLNSCSISTSEGIQVKTESKDGNIKYDLPLIVTVEGECNAGTRTLYEIKKDGTFTFNKNQDIFVNTSEDGIVTRQLTGDELKFFIQFLNEIDLVKLSENDEKLSPGVQLTEECRAVEYFNFVYNGMNKILGKNERLIKHSKEYSAGIEKLKTRLEQLRDKSEQKNVITYDLPLKITLDMECNLGNKTLYEVNAKGLFSYSKNETESLPGDEDILKTEQLTDEQLKELKSLIQEINISALAEKDTPVLLNSGQTADCRGIENYSLMVNSSSKTFDYNGRNLNHTAAYLDGLERIKSRLKSLVKSESASSGSNKYSLPLVLKLESECGLGSKTNFDIDMNGVFKFHATDNINDPAMITKQLTKEDLDSLNNLIGEADPAKLAEKDEKIPAGSSTTECRTVEKLSVNVNSTSRIFDKNSREIKHSKEYSDAFEKIKAKLEELRKKYLS